MAVLFRSVAKETDKADSDVDLLVVSNMLMLEDLFRTLGPVEERLGRRINPTLYTTVEFDARRKSRNPFLTKVLTGKHHVLLGELNDHHGTEKSREVRSTPARRSGPGGDRWPVEIRCAMTDRGADEPPDAAEDLPHELCDELWGAECNALTKVEAFWLIYDDLPGYGWLMYGGHEYPHWSADVRDRFWSLLRDRLGSSDEALGRPVAYWLWCDWFEDGTRVDEAWREVTRRLTDRHITRAVLRASGPVPWELKVELYGRLIHDAESHPDIFASILRSAFDLYGQIDPLDAQGWLARLRLSPQPSEWGPLMKRLGAAA
ncbi:MAG: nucleotidyltransferase domain-containing protein [Polyangiaceae bacterium]|nr:nucleotidyltransferase domain-containing protein [Polyangiaceae bacterium]